MSITPCAPIQGALPDGRPSVWEAADCNQNNPLLHHYPYGEMTQLKPAGQRMGQLAPGFALSVDQANLCRPVAHAGDEIHQATLVGMGGIATQGDDAGTDIDTFAIQIDVTAAWAVGLDGVPGRATRLVADEQHIVAAVAEHGLEVVDDAPARAHAIAGDDDGGPRRARQVLDHAFMLAVTVDGDQLLEPQWASAGLDSAQCFLVPERLQLAVGGGEA